MSFQELKEKYILRIEKVEDARTLELLAEFANQVLPPDDPQSPGLTDDELVAALHGRAQIARGEFKTHEQMKAILEDTLASFRIRQK